MQIQLDAKKIALTGYVALSALYIAYAVAIDFRDGLLRNAYETGRTETVNALIAKATDGKCEAFNVFSGEKKVDLVNVACLQKSPDTSASPQTAAPVSK